MTDIPQFFAFISPDGRIAGLARRQGKKDAIYGTALAVLDTPCDLDEWKRLLLEEPTVSDATARLVRTNGGKAVRLTVPLREPCWLCTPATVGEA